MATLLAWCEERHGNDLPVKALHNLDLTWTLRPNHRLVYRNYLPRL